MTIKRRLIDWKGLKAFGWPDSRTHTWRMMSNGKFPRCTKLWKDRSSHPVWRMKDIIEHLATLGLVIDDADAP